MDGRVVGLQPVTGIETPAGVDLLEGVVLVDIGGESRMALHQHSAVEDGVEVSDGERTGIVTATVMMITGGYHHLEGIVTRHLPDALDAGLRTVGEVGGDRKTLDPVVHPAETPDTIERVVNQGRRRVGVLCDSLR